MNSDAPSLDSWIFEDIETALRVYAESNNAVYDKTRPLSCLPEGSAQNVLRTLGVTYAQVTEMVNVGYQTVAGWFNAKRRPNRSTVKYSIYPVLCESYRRSACLTLSSELDRKDIGQRVFLLLTTGSSDTPQEIQQNVEEARERFHRAALIYAARTLNASDLTSVAHSALGFLALNHGSAEYDSAINWDIARGSNLITMRGTSIGETSSAEDFDRATSVIGQRSWLKGIEELSDDQLHQCALDIEDEIQNRKCAVS